MKNKESNTKEKRPVNPHEWIKSASTIITVLCTVATVVCSFLAIFYAKNIVKNINQQTQVVIEPRDGDIIVKDGNDYKLLQLIHVEDITFPTKVQEIQLSKDESNKDIRVDIGNTNNEDWTERDSFKYIINQFSINSNKVINLLENISSITVYCDFYSEKNISTFIELNKPFSFEMRKSKDEKEFNLTIEKKESDYEYVTKEVNDGIEWVKIRVVITYLISDVKITDIITSDWIETDADLI